MCMFERVVDHSTVEYYQVCIIHHGDVWGVWIIVVVSRMSFTFKLCVIQIVIMDWG